MKNVVAIFDAGKTNKKLLLFDEQYKVVLERSARFTEITDEDGFPCENIEALSSSVIGSLQEVIGERTFNLRAVNFSAYGASFVYLDAGNKVVAPLYNYLKPYPPHLLQKFYDSNGGEVAFSRETASPVLGNLNSGMQLYRLKNEQRGLFDSIEYALHLPQYLSWLISGKQVADLTSIGCHTNLWNFNSNEYHAWVTREGVIGKMAPIANPGSTITTNFLNHTLECGAGMHDSSAALLPYLVHFREPFVLISTGTWCITLNPFNDTPLTNSDLENDCLSYLQNDGKPVKAARLFAGYQHDQEVKRIAAHFNIDATFYRSISYQDEWSHTLDNKIGVERPSLNECDFIARDMNLFKSSSEAYHQLMLDIIRQEVFSTGLVLKGQQTKRIFVDGGFSKNEIFMQLLAKSFPTLEVYATFMSQASALGAALSIHSKWNTQPIPSDIIELKYYSSLHSTA